MSESNNSVSLDQAKTPFFVGIDLGGTNTKFGVVDDNGQTIARLSIPTRVTEGRNKRRRASAKRFWKSLKRQD